MALAVASRTGLMRSPLPLSTVRLEQGPIPLYYQLEKDLRLRIEKGEFAPGAPLPTEDQICEQYGVSRITVRRALDGLNQQGLIVRRRGVGSFVAEPRPGINSHLTGSLPEFLASAALMTVRRLSVSVTEPPAEVQALFDLEPEEKAWLMTAVGHLDDKPVSYLQFWFPSGIGERLNLAKWEPGTPVIRLVERELEIRVTKAHQLVEADCAGPVAARHLGVDATTPILKVQRIYYSESGPVEIAYVRYHPERYRYEIEFR
jgi:GntR family transcriptional regulator